MIPIAFHIPGRPRPQPRPRSFARIIDGKAVARVYDAASAESWKSQIAEAVKDHIPTAPLAGLLRLSCEFRFERPQYHFRTGRMAGQLKDVAPTYYAGRRGDLDNIIKALKDALTTLRLWRDDSQVVQYGRMDMVYGEVAESWVLVEDASDEPGPARRVGEMGLFQGVAQ